MSSNVPDVGRNLRAVTELTGLTSRRNRPVRKNKRGINEGIKRELTWIYFFFFFFFISMSI